MSTLPRALVLAAALLAVPLAGPARADYDPGADRSTMSFSQMARDTDAMAHRGLVGWYGSRYADEDTTRSALHAVSTGADVVEGDIRMTYDGVPVVLHDPTTTRVTGRTCRMTVAGHTWSEVHRCRLRHGDPISSLTSYAGALAPYRNRIGLELELKDTGLTTTRLRTIAATLAQHGFDASNVRYQSRSLTNLRAMRQVSPDVPSDWVTDSAPHSYDLPSGTDGLLLPYARLVAAEQGSPGYAERIVKAGRRVVPFDVDTTARMRGVIARGVTGLITNRVDLVAGLRR